MHYCWSVLLISIVGPRAVLLVLLIFAVMLSSIVGVVGANSGISCNFLSQTLLVNAPTRWLPGISWFYSRWYQWWGSIFLYLTTTITKTVIFWTLSWNRLITEYEWYCWLSQIRMIISNWLISSITMNGAENSSHFDDNRMTLVKRESFLRRAATIWSIFLIMNDSGLVMMLNMMIILTIMIILVITMMMNLLKQRWRWSFVIEWLFGLEA